MAPFRPTPAPAIPDERKIEARQVVAAADERAKPGGWGSALDLVQQAQAVWPENDPLRQGIPTMQAGGQSGAAPPHTILARSHENDASAAYEACGRQGACMPVPPGTTGRHAWCIHRRAPP